MVGGEDMLAGAVFVGPALAVLQVKDWGLVCDGEAPCRGWWFG